MRGWVTLRISMGLREGVGYAPPWRKFDGFVCQESSCVSIESLGQGQVRVLYLTDPDGGLQSYDIRGRNVESMLYLGSCQDAKRCQQTAH